MYKVLENFMDAVDGLHLYEAGDTYPRKGYKPDPERVKYLASSKNGVGRPLIVQEAAKKK